VNSWTGWKVTVACILCFVGGFMIGGGPYAAAQGDGQGGARDTMDIQLSAVEVAPPTRNELYVATLHACRQNERTADALVQRIDQQSRSWIRRRR
jgi:hypothetical protein